MRWTVVAALSLGLLSAPAFAASGGGPTREQVQQKFSKKAVKMYDRAMKTDRGPDARRTPIVSEKDDFSQLVTHGGRRTDLTTIAKGQFSAIGAVERERGGVREQVVRNYRERSLLGGLLRVKSTVGYRMKWKGGDAPAEKQLLKNQKIVWIGGLVPVPWFRDGKKILKTVQ